MNETLEIAEPEVAEPIVVVKGKQETDSKNKPKTQPPYVVLVHNDELHTFEYVVEVLQRVCGHNIQQALQLTSQVHHAGRAAVWTGTLEVAELKRDQIRGFGPDFYADTTVRFPLGATIEPLPGE